MADAFDLTLDLIGAAGKVGAIARGGTNKWTQLSQVVRGAADRVETYNNNQLMLQAQQDLAMGTINKGLREEHEAYNLVVLQNEFDQAGRALQGRIRDGEFDDMTPEEFGERGNEFKAQIMTAAGQADSAIGLASKWLFDNQTKFYAEQGERYRKTFEVKKQRTSEVAAQGLIEGGHVKDYHEFRDALPLIRDNATKDRILGKVAITLATQGRREGIDMLLSAPKTAENAAFLKQANSHLQSYNAKQYNHKYVTDEDAMLQSAEQGVFNDAAWTLHVEKYRSQRTGKEWATRYSSLAAKSRAANARRLQIKAGMDAVAHGMYSEYTLAKYGINPQGMKQADNEYVTKFMKLTQGKPDSRRQQILQYQGANPHSTTLAGYFGRSLLLNGVDSAGNVSADARNAAQTAVQLIRGPGQGAAYNALGKSMKMAIFLDEYLTGDRANDFDGAIRAWYKNGNVPYTFTPETTKTLSNMANSLTNAYLTSNKLQPGVFGRGTAYWHGRTAVEDPTVLRSVYMQEMRTALKTGVANTEEQAARIAKGKVESMSMPIDGSVHISKRSDFVRDQLRAEPQAVVDFYKNHGDADMHLSRLFAGTIDPEYAKTLRWKIGGNETSFLLIDPETGRQVEEVPFSMAESVMSADRMQRQTALSALDLGIENEETAARNEVYDGLVREMIQAADPDTYDQRRADFYQRELDEIRPGMTLEDFGGLGQIEKHQIIKELTTRSYVDLHSKLKVYWERVRAGKYQPIDEPTATALMGAF